jgi:hypothetical protein
MTTEINKYHTSKIYKISSNQCEKFYIGSTTQTLKERLIHHKKDYKKYIEKGIGSLTSFEVVKFDDAIIELIKDVKCESRKELYRIEGECILEHHNRILNKNVAGRTMKEYRETHKNEIKEWREAHKNEIKDKQKEYREAHKNEIKDKQKEYREANKEKINERKCEKFDCVCGGKYNRGNKSLHEKTKLHQLYISNQS